MAVAFLGLLFAHEPVISQLSFLVVVAVLVDTFLVRGLLVPAMMILVGRWNWWPRTMPSSTSDEEFAAYYGLGSMSSSSSLRDAPLA